MMLRCWFVLGLFFASRGASAVHITSDFDANFGFGAMNITAADDFSRTIESLSLLELNYNLNVSSADIALSFCFQEMIASDFGTIPFTRISLGPRWYVTGLNGRREIFDSETDGKRWRPSPFVGATLGLSNFSVEDPEENDNFVNAALFDILVKIGTEIPIAADWILMGQFGYFMGLTGASGAAKKFTYDGLQMMAGIKLSTF